MKPYSKIPFWETKKRLADLQAFYDDVVEYFNNCETGAIGGLIENDKALDARCRINLSLQKARNIVYYSGVSMVVTYQPPPMIGGLIQNVDVIQNIFNITQFQIPPATITGTIEQAIGVYTDDIAPSWRRTLNPFWWLGRLLMWIAHLPFLLIKAAGFDAEKAEQSLIGKLVSLVVAAIPLVAGSLAILDRLGYLGVVKDYFR